MQVLGIETSCDETGVAVYDAERGLVAHQLYSQIEIHAKYGGVVPELASRDHIRKLLPLIEQSHNKKSCHCGKVPTRICEHDRNEIEQNKLRRQLEQAVKNEDYEAAAKLRDQIQANP